MALCGDHKADIQAILTEAKHLQKVMLSKEEHTIKERLGSLKANKHNAALERAYKGHTSRSLQRLAKPNPTPYIFCKGYN